MRSQRKLGGLICLLLALSLLAACSPTSDWDEVGNVYIKQTGVSYLLAPYCYEPVMTDREYSIMKTGKVTVSLYEVEGEKPERLLADDFNTLLYASDYKLPALWEMGVDVVTLTNNTGVGAAQTQITDPARIASLVEACQTGPSFKSIDGEAHLSQPVTHNATVRFSSPSYPGFTYTLTYLCFESDLVIGELSVGKAFLYDRYEDCYYAIGDLLDGVLA